MTYKDLKPWLDDQGLVTHKKGVRSGNGLLYSAFALHRMGSPWPELEAGVRGCNAMGGSFKHFLPMNTWSNEFGLCSVDNFIGLALLGLWYPDIPARILYYGQTTDRKWWWPYYHYNNQNTQQWDKAAWIGRQPQIIAALKWSAGSRPNLLEWVWWCVTVLLSMTSTKSSRKENWFLTYALCVVADSKGGGVTRWVCNRFYKRLQNVWGHAWNEYPLANVFKSYFSVADHPLSK